MRLQAYRIAFTGQASSTLCAAYDGCQITMGPGASIPRAEPPGQSAVRKLPEQIAGFGRGSAGGAGAPPWPHASRSDRQQGSRPGWVRRITIDLWL
jgi:hypothetical protein